MVQPDDVQSRVQQIRQAMQTAFGFIPPPQPLLPLVHGGPPPAPPLPGSTLRIFLAPEYFFRKQFTNCRNRKITTAYSEDEKNLIERELSALSRCITISC